MSRDVVTILDEITRAQLISILHSYGVKQASIFGSFARGDQQSESDIDLVIEPPADATLFTLAQIEAALEKVVGRKVDIITFNALNSNARPRLRQHILHDLRVLLA